MKAETSFTVLNAYNKTIIHFNFGKRKDLSTIKSDIHLSLVAR